MWKSGPEADHGPTHTRRPAGTGAPRPGLPAAVRSSWLEASRWLLVVSVSLMMLLSACGPRQPLSIVLISIDTLRADHLGCYGSDEVHTPNIDALAQRSRRFEWCFSAVPITLPSHTTMLTGLYPLHHSVRDNGTFTVPGTIPTVATRLAAAGWTTIGVVGAYPITARFGLSRGFDVWDEELDQRSDQLLPLAFTQRSADSVTRAALRRLKRHADDGPVLLFVHYFDPHRPWTAPAVYARQYRDNGYGAEIAFTDAWIGELLRGIETLGMAGRTAVILTADHGEGLSEHEEETHSFLLYNGTVRVPLMVSAPGLEPGVESGPVSVADVAATILDLAGVEPMPMDGRTLLAPQPPDRLIYMESLAGRLQHGWNDMRGAVAGDRKLVLGPEPELYDHAGDPGERHDLHAAEPGVVAELQQRLLDQIASGHTASGHTAPGRGDLSLAERFARPAPEVAKQLEALGYLVPIDDPGELAELGAITPDGDPRKHLEVIEVQSVARSLISSGSLPLALETLTRAERTYPGDIEIERLLLIATSLAGSTDQAAARARRLLARPEALGRDLLLAAGVLLDAGALDEALDAISRARRVEPAGEHEVLEARILAAAGRPSEAVAVLETFRAISPCSRSGLIQLAAIRRDSGELEAARAAYEALLECNPRDVQAMTNLGTLALAQGDVDLADEHFTAAAALDPGYAYARYGQGLVALQRQDRDDALRLLDEVLAFEPLTSPLARRTIDLIQRIEETSHE